MKYRFNDYQHDMNQSVIPERNHTLFADMVDKLPRIIPNVRDIAVSSYDFSIEEIQDAILDYDLKTMREISNYFYRSSVLYKRLILYFSNLHKFYWMDMPTIVSTKQSKNNKNDRIYLEVLNYIQKFRLSDSTPDILNQIFREGAFYGYLNEGETHNTWQTLPSEYCRSTYRQDGISVVEFNIKYFDDKYRDEETRLLILKKYPAEFKQWYNKYKNGTLTSDGNEVWVPLKSEFCTRLVLSDDECPVFFPILVEIIRLDKNKKVIDEQALQQLFKLLIQKMPLNKNSDLIFDIEETKAIHKQASQMLSKAPGVDLFTTWADVELLNVDSTDAINKSTSIASTDSFYEGSGTSQMLFSTKGNLSLDASQRKDSALVFRILESYSSFINKRLNLLFNMKQVNHHFKFLDITIFNQDDMIKLYKEQATLGYAKLTLAIAMGFNQAELPGVLDLEVNQLKIGELLIPLQTSYTISRNEQEKETEAPTTEGGRPVIPETEKAPGTIENINR